MSLLLDALKQAALEMNEANNALGDSAENESTQQSQDNNVEDLTKSSAVTCSNEKLTPETKTLDAEDEESNQVSIDLDLDLDISNSNIEVNEIHVAIKEYEISNLEESTIDQSSVEGEHGNSYKNEKILETFITDSPKQMPGYNINDSNQYYDEIKQNNMNSESILDELPSMTHSEEGHLHENTEQLDNQPEFIDDKTIEANEENDKPSYADQEPLQTNNTKNLVLTQEEIEEMISGAFSATAPSEKVEEITSTTELRQDATAINESENFKSIQEAADEHKLEALITHSNHNLRIDHKKKYKIIAASTVLIILIGVSYYIHSFIYAPVKPYFQEQGPAESAVDDSVFNDEQQAISTTIQKDSKPLVNEEKNESQNSVQNKITSSVQTQKKQKQLPNKSLVNNDKLSDSTKVIAAKKANLSRSESDIIRQSISAPKLKKDLKTTAFINNTQLIPPEAQNLYTASMDVSKTVEDELSEAYVFFHQQKFNEARGIYKKVLLKESNSRDALLGLAAVETEENNFIDAIELYQKILIINPADDVAQAGILQVSTRQDPVQIETQLKIYIEQSPNSAFLRFVLGSVYADRYQWKQALYQFTEAVKMQPTNADINYNLAVSYDQLGQYAKALPYYEWALNLSWSQNVNFTKSLVERRINQIQASLRSR